MAVQSGLGQLEEDVLQAHAGTTDLDEANSTVSEHSGQPGLGRVGIAGVDPQLACLSLAHRADPGGSGEGGEKAVRGWTDDHPQGRRGHGEEIGEVALVDESALRQHADAVADPLDVGEVVAGDEHCGPTGGSRASGVAHALRKEQAGRLAARASDWVAQGGVQHLGGVVTLTCAPCLHNFARRFELAKA